MSVLDEKYQWLVVKIAMLSGGILTAHETKNEALEKFQELKPLKVGDWDYNKNGDKIKKDVFMSTDRCYKVVSREEFAKLPNWRKAHPGEAAQADQIRDRCL